MAEHVKSERRRHPRYDAEMKVYFHVKYDIKTRVRFKVLKGDAEHKYSGLCKNVSAEGLCFVARKRLTPGDLLLIEVYEPMLKTPAIMEAEVRWCRPSSGSKRKGGTFQTGVRVVMVNGRFVRDTIYMDKEYKVVWSDVLDSLFGDFAAMIRKIREKKARR